MRGESDPQFLPGSVPVAAPPRVAARLRAAPDGEVRVVHRGRLAVYVEVGGRAVGVLAAGAVQVPCGLRTRLISLPDVRTARVRRGVLHLDEVAFRVGRLVGVRVPAVRGHVPLTATLPPGTVAGLVGRGDGLTPYGDDLLCGWLAVRRAARVPTPEVDAEVRSLLPRTTLLSATLLECAMAGEALPELAAYLRDPRAAASLQAVGGSSGQGLLAGAAA